jgi:subtilisin-like proprotein convertase family protein
MTPSVNLDVLKSWPGCACLFLFLIACESRGAVVVFQNTNAIAINDSANPPTIATPYPSTITVAGLTNQLVLKTTVTLHGLSHTFPSDIYMMLTGPQGQRTVLLAKVGGDGEVDDSVTNLTITLDDDAQTDLPILDPLVTGTFRPTSRDPVLGIDFPPPVPAGNSNSPVSLSVFDGTDPNGVWSLYVLDNVSGDSGSLSGGWSLNLTPGVPLQIARVQTNVVISWPTSPQTNQLQFSPALTNANAWSNVTSIPVLISGRYVVTNAVAGAARFYRLTGN